MTAKPSLSRAKPIPALSASSTLAVPRSERRGRQTKPGARLAEPLTKRDQLVETAWQLFYHEGYHATGIDRILAKAGVAKMTLYKHFRSKEELILAVLEKRSAQFQESFSRFLQAKKRTPERELLGVFDWLIAWVERKDFRGCLFQKALAEYQEMPDPIHQAAVAHKAAFHREIRRLVSEAGLTKPRGLGDQLAVLAEGAIVNSHASSSSMPAVHAREAAQALIKGAQRIR
jgi:AcrR family transcriptional regulator